MLHPLLARQIRRCGIQEPELQPPSWGQLLERVSAAYQQADDDRYLLERSLAISSTEMAQLNASLQTSVDTLAGYRAALDEQAIIAITDRAGVITDVSEPFCRISQFSREELIGARHSIINSGHHPREFWVTMWRTIARGEIWRAEVCNRAKDGSLYWVDTVIGPMRGIGDEISGFIAVRQDITARKQAELALLRVQRVLEETSRIARVGGWELGVDGALWWSNQVSEICSLNGALPATLAEFVARFEVERRVVLATDIATCIAGGAAFDHTARFITGTGAEIWVRCRGRIETVGNGEKRLYGSLQDVSEWQQRSQELARALTAAEAAAKAKDGFLANMSHEIRTPLTAILGYVDLLREEGDLSRAPARRIEIIDTIRHAGVHLSGVIDDILDLSKLQASAMTLESTSVCLADLLGQVIAILRPLALAKGIVLEGSLAPDLPAYVATDPTRLRQILMNLAGNAVKFTASGSVVVRAACDTRAGGAWLRISVEDTGIGLAPAQTARLFEAFAQADDSMSRRFGGTGLGLVLSRRLARLMGGDVTLVRSAPGLGSCFSLELPLTVANAPVPESGSDQNEAGVPGMVTLSGRILLVEDSPVNQRLVAAVLRKAGAEVDTADDGEAALRRIDESPVPYDLIVSDMQMPVMDGYTMASSLRARGCHVAIIALTAHAMEADRERCLAAGCDAYATKPIDRPSLLAMCARWMRRASAAATTVPTDSR